MKRPHHDALRPGRIGLLFAAAAAAGCASFSDGAGRDAPRAVEFPVEVETAEARPVDYVIPAVGSVEAFETVQVVARVPGAIDRVRFVEGDEVQAGEILVEVEPARYRIEVDSARAALERASSELADARAALARRDREPGLFPIEDVETHRTRVSVTEANVEAQRAALARAELNLQDAHVRAPSSGTVETRSVVTGQYVQAGTVLATLVRREPLLLRFDVPEPDAARLAPGMQVRFQVPGDDDGYTAEITHVAGFADSASRMVPVTARITDAQRAELRPGSFADVRVPVGRSEESPVIPQTAIRPTERGFLAYVIEDGKARERLLELGLRTADGRVEVRSGLLPGEVVVVRGAEALREGAAVRIQGGAPAGLAAESAP